MRTRAMIGILGMALAVTVPAEEIGHKVYDTGHWGEREIQEPEAWKEQGKSLLPPTPQAEDLVEVPSDLSGYTVSLDAKHLSLGDDWVVRYTVVLESRSGARNVYFEGLRCDTKEYKTYGYGTGGGELQEFPGSEWRPVVRSGPAPFRFELLSFYFCDSIQRPLAPEKILQILGGRSWSDPANGSIYDQ